eukprot:scaffold752_cov322-Pavlova_lutheri.AAC.58
MLREPVQENEEKVWKPGAPRGNRRVEPGRSLGIRGNGWMRLTWQGIRMGTWGKGEAPVRLGEPGGIHSSIPRKETTWARPWGHVARLAHPWPGTKPTSSADATEHPTGHSHGNGPSYST